MVRSRADDEIGRIYDETPYPSAPYPQTHPDHLAVIGTLFDMRPPELPKCRVLELGCADAGNIIPMAVNLPEAEFVGVDLSARHIAAGQQLVDRLGLTNIQLLQQSLVDLDPSLGIFDYIIAHGVFSWVPKPVQEKILEICRRQLAKQGIAFVSYNTYPGWHLRGMLRDMMLYHTRRFEDPQQQIKQARALVQFLADEVSTKNSPYGLLLRRELEYMRTWGDSYLRHDSLGDVNEPLYFHEFVAKAKSHNLRYIGEAEFHSMLVGDLASTAAATLELLAADQIDMEQYMDFVRNRTFRQTLLCHSQVELDRSVAADRLAELHVASPLKPTNPQMDLQSDESERFLHDPSGNVVTAHRAILKAALLMLSEIWPKSMAFRELVARAQERSAGGGGQVSPKQDRIAVGELLLRCYAKNLLVLHAHPPRIAASVSHRPVASPLARLQAGGDGAITTQRHDRVQLDGTHRRLLSLLDGTRDRHALVEQLTEHTLRGNLKLEQGGETISNPTRIRELIAGEIPPCLQRLAQNALLIG